jgi:multiple sugar transport system substrate-binding protein
MKKKNLFVLFVITLLALLIVTGCQPEEVQVEVTRVVTETEQVEVTRVITEVVEIEGEEVEVTRVVETVVEVEVPVVSEGDREEIRFLLQENDPPSLEAFLSMENEFEAEYPQYDVVMEITNPDVIGVKVASVIASGGTLDVFQPDPAMAARLAQEGSLLPIDGVIDSFGGPETFFKNTLLQVDDVSYCMPYASGSPVLWYREDVFEEAGLEPPDTWEDLLAVSEAINSDEMAAIAVPGGENLFTTIMLQHFMWQSGTQVFDIDGNTQVADNERAAEALQFYGDLLQYAPEGATGYSFGEVIDAYTSGRVAMLVYWGRVLGRLYDNAPDLVDITGVVPLPMNRMRATFADISYNCINAFTDHPDAATAWLEFMARPEQAVKLQLTVPGHLAPVTAEQAAALLASGNVPLTENPDIADVLFGVNDYAYNLNLNRGGIDEENLKILTTGIVNAESSTLWGSNILARAVQEVFINGGDPAEVLAEAQAEIEEALEITQ